MGGIIGRATNRYQSVQGSTQVRTNSVLRLIPKKKLWTDVHDMLKERSNHVCTAWDGYIWACGPETSCEVMQPGHIGSAPWQQAPPMWRMRSRSAMVATPSRGIVVIGGSGTRSVEQIPSHELFWAEGPSLPYVLEDMAAIAIGESIYLLGGWMSIGATDNILMLSEGGIRWMKIAKLQRARHWFASVRYGDDLWCIGGELDGTSEVFHSAANTSELLQIDGYKPTKGTSAAIIPAH